MQSREFVIGLAYAVLKDSCRMEHFVDYGYLVSCLRRAHTLYTNVGDDSSWNTADMQLATIELGACPFTMITDSAVMYSDDGASQR